MTLWLCRQRQVKHKKAADAEKAAESYLLELRAAGSKLHSINAMLADHVRQDKEAQLEKLTKAIDSAKERQAHAESSLQAC